jgi:hypothetical protein
MWASTLPPPPVLMPLLRRAARGEAPGEAPDTLPPPLLEGPGARSNERLRSAPGVGGLGPSNASK